MRNLKKQKLKQSRGITLVALIITIIVLIILAMVSIRLVMNEGIIDKATRGVNEYSESEVEEQIKLAYSEWQTARWTGETKTVSDFMKDKLNEIFGEGAVAEVTEGDGTLTIVFTDERVYTYNVSTGKADNEAKWSDNGNNTYTNSKTGKTIKVGDIVKYEDVLALPANEVDNKKKAQLISDFGNYSGNTDANYNTNSSIVRDSLTWKVLDVENGKIRLISSEPTASKIRLYSYNGYNNVVYLIDEACSTLYSSTKGTAKNLKIEDIEKHLTYDYTEYANSNADTGKYGGTKEFTSNLDYPKIYASEIGCKAIATEDNTGNTLGLSEQTSPITGSAIATNRLKVTLTYWYKSMATTDFTDPKYYELFINNGSNMAYMLSSRCAFTGSTNASFNVRGISGGAVDHYHMVSMTGWSNAGVAGFRPVITLNYGVQLLGDSTNGWTIQ